MGKAGCQLALSTWGLAHVVPTAPSGPIQNTSRAPANRVTAQTGLPSRAAPPEVMGNGGCQTALSTRGFAHVVPTAPSWPIQKASSAPPQAGNHDQAGAWSRSPRRCDRKRWMPVGIVYLGIGPRGSDGAVGPDPKCVESTIETGNRSHPGVRTGGAGRRDRKRRVPIGIVYLRVSPSRGDSAVGPDPKHVESTARNV